MVSDVNTDNCRIHMNMEIEFEGGNQIFQKSAIAFLELFNPHDINLTTLLKFRALS